jgi:hypothetical protein
MSIRQGFAGNYRLFGGRRLLTISAYRLFGVPKEIVVKPDGVRYPVHLRVRTPYDQWGISSDEQGLANSRNHNALRAPVAAGKSSHLRDGSNPGASHKQSSTLPTSPDKNRAAT